METWRTGVHSEGVLSQAISYMGIVVAVGVAGHHGKDGGTSGVVSGM